MSLDALLGSPVAFERSLDAYHRGAAAIDEAIAALDRLTSSSEGEAMVAVRERVTKVRTGVTLAQGRYSQTANALDHYVEPFEQAHAKANRAIGAFDDADSQRRWMARRVFDLKEDLALAVANGAPDADRESIEMQLSRAREERRQAERAMEEARGEHSNAQSDLDQAAMYAIAAIGAVFDQTNDGWRDHVRNFVEEVGDFFAAIAEWIGDVLKVVLDALIEVILFLLDALSAVLILLTIVWAIGLAIFLILNPGLLVLLLAAVATLFVVADQLGLSDQWKLWLVAGVISVVLPPLGLFILTRAAHEALSPDPEITYADTRSELEAALGDHCVEGSEEQEAVGDLRDGAYAPTSAEALYARAAAVDDAGGDHHTVVDIVTITDEFGNERHIVTLPSTTDWGHIAPLMQALKGGSFADGGATNDLDANVVEMLFPGVIDTQYERGVVEALRQLVDSGEPVMFVGFSQGGIMSTLMTDQHGTEFNVSGLLTAGSPHSTFHIPGDVEHVHTVHTGDVVPWTDMSIETQNVWTGTHRQLVAAPLPDESAHGATSYGATLGNNGQVMQGMFEGFLVDPGDVASGRVGISSTQAVWTEAR